MKSSEMRDRFFRAIDRSRNLRQASVLLMHIREQLFGAAGAAAKTMQQAAMELASNPVSGQHSPSRKPLARAIPISPSQAEAETPNVPSNVPSHETSKAKASSVAKAS